MKNGEEVVSVGGAVDPSLKNIGTSASNSVLLDLAKVTYCITIPGSRKKQGIKDSQFDVPRFPQSVSVSQSIVSQSVSQSIVSQ